MFISPHISTFRERISINNQMIEMNKVVDYSELIFQTAEKYNLQLTFFEIVTLIAFL